MRQSSVLFFLIFSFFLSGCSGDNITEARMIGKGVFDLLQSLDDTNKDDFAKHFVTLDEMHDYVEDERAVKDESTRKKVLGTTPEMWESQLRQIFNEVYYFGIEHDIKWRDIVYKDFEFMNRMNNGLKTCEGTLDFEFGDKKFRISTISVDVGSLYRLLSITSIRPLRY